MEKKKEILQDHWITKELGLEVFIYPDEIANFIYFKTSNGVIHRYGKQFLDDKEASKPFIEELNKKRYNDLLFFHKFMVNSTHDLIQLYFVSGEVKHLNLIQELIKESRKTF